MRKRLKKKRLKEMDDLIKSIIRSEGEGKEYRYKVIYMSGAIEREKSGYLDVNNKNMEEKEVVNEIIFYLEDIEKITPKRIYLENEVGEFREVF
jgi:hypothetical protein